MEIQHEVDDQAGRFFTGSSENPTALLTYSIVNDDRIMIEHTVVDNSLSGKGIGKQLVDEAVAYARKKNFKVVPMCSFARSIFSKVKGYEDVL